MRYLKFTEDFEAILVNRPCPDRWTFPLYNSDCSYLFAPPTHDGVYFDFAKSHFSLHGIDILFRDDITGQAWSLVHRTPEFVYEQFQCQFHPTHIKIVTEANGVCCTLELLVPVFGSVLSVAVHLERRRGDHGSATLYAISDIANVAQPEQLLWQAGFHPETNSVYARCCDQADYVSNDVAFLYAENPLKGFDCQREKVYGRSRDFRLPSGVRLGKTFSSNVEGGDVTLLLAADCSESTVRTAFLLGVCAPSDRQSDLSTLPTFINQYGTYTLIQKAIQEKKTLYATTCQPGKLSWALSEYRAYFNYWIYHELIFSVQWSKRLLGDGLPWLRTFMCAMKGYLRIVPAQDGFDLILYIYSYLRSSDYYSLSDIEKIELILDFIQLLCHFERLFRQHDVLLKIVHSSPELFSFCFEYLFDLSGHLTSEALLRVGRHARGVLVFTHEDVFLSFKLYHSLSEFLMMTETVAGMPEAVLQLRTVHGILVDGLTHLMTKYSVLPYYLPTQRNNSEIPLHLATQLMAWRSGLLSSEQWAPIKLKMDRKLRTPHGYMSIFPAYRGYSDDAPAFSSFLPGTAQNGGIVIRDNIDYLIMELQIGDPRSALKLFSQLVPITSSRMVGQERSWGEPYFMASHLVSTQHAKDEGLVYPGLLSGYAGLLYDAVVENYSRLAALMSELTIKENEHVTKN